jgi:hypothetical protein
LNILSNIEFSSQLQMFIQLSLFQSIEQKVPGLEIDQINRFVMDQGQAPFCVDALAMAGLLKKEKKGKNNFYINEPLFKLFQESRQ